MAPGTVWQYQRRLFGKAPKAINRRFTQMDADRNPFKNITAEAQRGTSRQIAVSSGQKANRNLENPVGGVDFLLIAVL